ncbi:MAG: DUF4938 domain-containing protein [Kouleothrix sp.]|nr:DUF4938 domain-containing protein [Kouleothrix sp.]
MPTEIIQLLGFDGPNLHGPQPGVFLKVRSDKDRSRRLKDALKDGAQSVGMVLGYLGVETEPGGGGYIIGASFSTPTPAIGVELARYIVEGLNRKEAGDEEWDAEGPLWDLQKRRRTEALPLQALQLTAEAASRGIPTLMRVDGQVQLGHGARGWAFDPSQLKSRTGAGALADDEVGIGPPPFARSESALDAPWDRLGPIPILAVSGGQGRDIAASLIAATLHAQDQATSLSPAADYDATRELLAEPNAAIAVVGLTPEGIARRGLAFERCAYSAITELPTELPAEVADRAELARVLGVPMLLTDPAGRVALNADVPEIVALAEYAPCPIIYTSAAQANPLVVFHCAEGGQALFVRDGAVIAASGASEQAVAAATLPPDQLAGVLAGLALLWAVGLTWEQITAMAG